MYSVSIVIPTFNRKNLLKNLLEQLYGQKKLPKTKFSIIIVVDGSTDGSLEMLQSDFPEVHIVRGDGTWWYTKSMNEGFKYAEKLNPDFVLTLNDDVEIKENYIKNLLDAYNKVEPGSIMGSVSVSVNKPYRITNSGNRVRNKFFGLYRNYLPFLSEVDLKTLTGIKETMTLPGRGMLLPISTLKKLNYFDEQFTQYHSDTDFCLRAHARGFGVYLSWDAVVFSHVNLTSSSSSFKKQSLKSFINSFFDRYSRNYLPDRIMFIWRHNTKIGMPLVLLFSLLIKIKNFYFKKKLV